MSIKKRLDQIQSNIKVKVPEKATYTILSLTEVRKDTLTTSEILNPNEYNEELKNGNAIEGDVKFDFSGLNFGELKDLLI